MIGQNLSAQFLPANKHKILAITSSISFHYSGVVSSKRFQRLRATRSLVIYSRSTTIHWNFKSRKSILKQHDEP